MSTERQAGDSVEAQDVIATVDAALTGTMFQGKLHHFPTIDSTQTRAIAAAQAGAGSGQVYVADEQTAGRGRGGHTWNSQPGNGLYVTVLLRPALRADDALTLSFAAGLAARSAIADVTGHRIDLRWPNDLVTPGPGSRKVGGILTETAMLPDGTLRYAAIGVGLNLNHATMPPDLESVSTSLRRWIGGVVNRQAMLAGFLRHLQSEVDWLVESPADTRRRFAETSTWVMGKPVSVAEDESYTGVTDGLTESGLLRVRCDNGQVREVRHGGVRELDSFPRQVPEE